MKHLLTTRCTIVHVTGWATDADGESSPTTSSTATACHMQPERTDDEAVRGDLDVRPRWRCWLPDGVTVTSEDTITVAGTRYRVLGAPRRWANPSQSINYLACTVEEVTP